MCKRDRIRDKDKYGKTQALCSKGKCRDKKEARKSVGLDTGISRHLECIISSLYNEIELFIWFQVVPLYINWSFLLNNLFMRHEIAQWVTGLTIRDDDRNSIGRENTTPTECPLAYTSSHTQHTHKSWQHEPHTNTNTRIQLDHNDFYMLSSLVCWYLS